MKWSEKLKLTFSIWAVLAFIYYVLHDGWDPGNQSLDMLIAAIVVTALFFITLLLLIFSPVWIPKLFDSLGDLMDKKQL